jgi:steroid delta-isomerase-like uncharacterized protein
MSIDNEALARRFFEVAWNERRPEALDDLITPESRCHHESGVFAGKEEFLQHVYEPFLAALPDLHIDLEEVISKGDVVAVRWLASGTHTGDGMGVPPTGRRVSFRGTSWIRFERGKMMEGFECWNIGGLMQVLSGGPPTPAMMVA